MYKVGSASLRKLEMNANTFRPCLGISFSIQFFVRTYLFIYFCDKKKERKREEEEEKERIKKLLMLALSCVCTDSCSQERPIYTYTTFIVSRVDGQ
jgi:hypothetical protein